MWRKPVVAHAVSVFIDGFGGFDEYNTVNSELKYFGHVKSVVRANNLCSAILQSVPHAFFAIVLYRSTKTYRPTSTFNKKLRYRKEHSASTARPSCLVGLLNHISREKIC